VSGGEEDMSKKPSLVKTKPVPLRLSENMIKGIDIAIKRGQGNNRSDIIKVAIANYLKELNIFNEIK
jgi:metal-responsive CopG/Arc/MetJ family transcriptional regulator